MSPIRKIRECFNLQRSKVKETELNLSCNLSATEPSSLNDPHLMFLPLAAQEQDSVSEKNNPRTKKNPTPLLPPQFSFESRHDLARRNFFPCTSTLIFLSILLCLSLPPNLSVC